MPERLTLAPGVEVPAPEDGSVLRYSGEAVQDVLDFFSLLCFAQNECCFANKLRKIFIQSAKKKRRLKGF